MNRCSCRSQLIRSASVLGLNPAHENPDWNSVQNSMIDKIYNDFPENSFVLVRPVGNCDSLAKSPFLALKKIPKKNRSIIKSMRKHWIITELQTLGAFSDIIDHVNGYSNDSPEMTLMSQILFYGSQFDAGRHLLKQLVQYIDLRPGSNKIIASVHDPEFREDNEIPMLRWAEILGHHAQQSGDAASRAGLLADYLIELGMSSNPATRSAIRKLIEMNCWNLW